CRSGRSFCVTPVGRVAGAPLFPIRRASPASSAATIDPMADAEPSLAELFQANRQGLAGAVRGVLGSGADIAETLQDAFLRCWQGWQRGERPRDPVAWIFVVTWNVAVDSRRRRQRRPPPAALDEDLPMAATNEAAPARALEWQEELARAQ